MKIHRVQVDVSSGNLLFEQLSEAVAREQQYFVESGPDRANADEALKSAHSLLVWSFAVADDLLELHMAAEVAKLAAKCVEIYQD